MSNEEVKRFESHCSKCVFAQYMDSWTGPYKIQNGCELNRLDKFRDQDRTTVENSPDQCYVIEGICNTNRGEVWAEANGRQDLAAKVEREIEINIDIILLSLDIEDNDIFNKLKTALTSCVKQQNIKPQRIVIVVKNKLVNFGDLYTLISDITTPYDIPFQLVQIADKDTDISDCVNMGMSKCRSQFVAVFDLKANISNNFTYIFNNIINTDLKRVVMVEPLSGYSGMIISSQLFEAFGKNHNMPIFTKIKEVAEEQGKTDMIITWEEL